MSEHRYYSHQKTIFIEPDELVFNPKEGKNKSSFAIKNKGPTFIAFKIKCSNPDAFMLEPVKGILKTNSKIMIDVILKDERPNKQERFVVLTKTAEDEHYGSKSLNDLFCDDRNVSYTYMNCFIGEDSYCEKTEDDNVLTNVENACRKVDRIVIIQCIILAFVLFTLFIINCDIKSKECKGKFLKYFL